MDITYHLYKELERHEKALANGELPNQDFEKSGDSGDYSCKDCGVFEAADDDDDNSLEAIEKCNNNFEAADDDDDNSFEAIEKCNNNFEAADNEDYSKFAGEFDCGGNISNQSCDNWDTAENGVERGFKNATDLEKLFETECEKLIGAGELCAGDDELVREAARIIRRLKQKASRAGDDLDTDYANRLSAAAEFLEKSLCGER